MSNKVLGLFNKKRIKAFFSSKDVLIFLFFLFLSFGFWYLNNLRKAYEMTMQFKINYMNIPIDKVNEDNLPQDIYATIKDQNFYLVSYKINKVNSINIDLKEALTSYRKNSLYISETMLEAAIKEQLHYTTNVSKINPTEIVIPIIRKKEKRIPVKYIGKISYAQQYSSSDSIKITPSHITVYGESSIVDTVSAIHTERINFENLQETVNKNIKLEKISGLQFDTMQVNIKIPVEKFTEKTIEVSILGINLPDNLQLRIFPAHLKVTFFIPFSRFNSVNGNDIEAFINYKNIVNNNTGVATPELKINNPFIFNVRTAPSEVEFLIEQK
jgi:hypothetical protein